MRVAIDHRRAGRQRGHVVHGVVDARPPHVAVREEQLAPRARRVRVWRLGVPQHVVVGHAGEVQHHLVDLRLAVAPHADDAVRDAVQHRDDLLRGVVRREVVAGPVVQEVTQKDDAVRLLGVDGVHEPRAPLGRTMDVGRNQELHDLLHFRGLHRGAT